MVLTSITLVEARKSYFQVYQGQQSGFKIPEIVSFMDRFTVLLQGRSIPASAHFIGLFSYKSVSISLDKTM